jgi:hypothetical protein
MGLEFEGPTEGWTLRCDTCCETEFTGAWQSADVLIDDELNSCDSEFPWKFEEYKDWDGVTFADAFCPDCNKREMLFCLDLLERKL